MQHVEAQAPARQARQRLQRLGYGAHHQGGPLRQYPLARRQPPPHHAQPGQQRHVVFGDRLARHQPDPVGESGVEKRVLNELREQQGDCAGQPQRAIPMRGEPHDDQHDRDRMQNAEADETARKHEPRPDADQQRAARHLQPASPEARPALAPVQGHRLPESRAEEKDRDDEAALRGPERVGIEVLLDDAEVVQIEEEVIHRHPDDRNASQRIEAVEAFVRGRANVHAGTISHLASRAARCARNMPKADGSSGQPRAHGDTTADDGETHGDDAVDGGPHAVAGLEALTWAG